MQNNNFKILPVLLSLTFALLIFSCTTQQNTTKKKNFSYIYNPSSTTLHPNYLIYHQTDNKSIVMVKFFPGELLFNQANIESEYQAEIKFSYKLFDYTTKTLEDSSSAVIIINLDEVREEMMSIIPFRAYFGKKYIIQIITKDLKRKSQHRAALIVDKTNRYNRQNYLIRLVENSAPIFNAIVDSNSVFHIEYAYGKIDSLNVKYFKNDFFIPTPPSINVVKYDKFEIPDSTYTLYMADTNMFRITKKGLYTFQVDTGRYNGVCLSYYNESFPYVTNVEDLIEPLYYLMNNTEYNNILKIPNKKLSVDNFWLETVNDNIEIAREIIRIYYNRVYLANYYFTSYKEGWKTDRGMIYIVYGLPNYIYKSDNSERWIYEEIQGSEKLYFKFKKIEHPYTDDHYVLMRSELLQTRWKDAIESWRNGKPYSFN